MILSYLHRWFVLHFCSRSRDIGLSIVPSTRVTSNSLPMARFLHRRSLLSALRGEISDSAILLLWHLQVRRWHQRDNWGRIKIRNPWWNNRVLWEKEIYLGDVLLYFLKVNASIWNSESSPLLKTPFSCSSFYNPSHFLYPSKGQVFTSSHAQSYWPGPEKTATDSELH